MLTPLVLIRQEVVVISIVHQGRKVSSAKLLIISQDSYLQHFTVRGFMVMEQINLFFQDYSCKEVQTNILAEKLILLSEKEKQKNLCM